MKIFFTYSSEIKEGFDSKIPLGTSDIPTESVEEVLGENVIEKVSNIIAFIDEVYRILAPKGVAKFTAPYYASKGAWSSPLTVRAICDETLNFASKDWREQTKFSEGNIICNFEVNGQFAIEQQVMHRAEEVRHFWLQRYNNVAQAVIFTLTKK